jgi:Putative lumazine-binding
MRFALAFLLALTTSQVASATGGDQAAVRAAVSVYLEGQATGDAEYYRRVFHPDARLHGVRDGKPEQRTLAEYLALQSGKPAADEADRKRTITNVVVTGDAAVATIVLDYPKALTTDHMSLIRNGDRWTIVHKLYNVRTRPTR